MQDIIQAKADAIEQCMDVLFAQPQPHEDEPMPDPGEALCNAKANGKGRALQVPELGEEDGPKWIFEGWLIGWKVRVGLLPGNISKAAIGHYCEGQVDISVHSHNTQSRIAYAIVTFIDLDLAITAFEQLAMATFDGDGEIRRATVKWFRGPE